MTTIYPAPLAGGASDRAALAPGQVRVDGPLGQRYNDILSDAALTFLAALHQEFGTRRTEVLNHRHLARLRIADGKDPDFDKATAAIRQDPNWRVAPIAPGLADRRIEITGPTDPKMTINALNSGAKVWLADFEDALSPTWRNVIEGQLSLRDAIVGQLEWTSPEGKEYRVKSPTLADLPTIVVRPRGWHLVEKHLRFIEPSGIAAPMSGSLVDFGLYFFHNAAELIERGRGPYFYIAKTQFGSEARLWNDVFNFAQDYLGIARGTIRATFLIETITAAFQMEEILYESREHCAGLNAGRWDYLFSIIKNYRSRGAKFILPDRGQVTMTAPFMRAYTELLVQTCHKRAAHAIGGMAAFIPNRRRPDITETAFAQVKADKLREASDGFDGSWVAHPDLIEVAREEFDNVLGDKPNQLDRLRADVNISQEDLLDIGSVIRSGATITSAGLRTNISVGIRYIESWLRGIGAAGIDNLMEDVATAEISRSQIWQWIYNRCRTTGGSVITRDRVETLVNEIVEDLPRPEGNRVMEAAEVFRTVALDTEFPNFLTIGAYSRYLVGSAPDLPSQGA